MTATRVGDGPLKAATGKLPSWVGDAVTSWVRERESCGHGFTSAAVAVRCALESMKGK